jgi:hypothetical protein
MQNFNDELDKYQSAARDAYHEFARATGVPLINRQEHLQAMRNMSVDDLDALADEYGVDQVTHYIKRLAGG